MFIIISNNTIKQIKPKASIYNNKKKELVLLLKCDLVKFLIFNHLNQILCNIILVLF